MYDFSQPSPNLILSTSGNALRILGRAGLQFETPGGNLDIDSEMLSPAISIVIYKYSISNELVRDPDATLAEVRSALVWAGFTVEVI
ncbi:MAG: hypothetical protein JWR35_2400 [Marmoricola sp.]|nr:hypothetical protein [Marmoricola sp.]